MATINTIISITDKISSQLNTIQLAVDSIKGSFEGLDTATNTAETTMNNFDWNKFASKAEEYGQKITDVGTKMTLGITAPLVLLGRKLYKTSTQHETAFVGMTKTVEGTVEQYEHLNQVAQEISETTPMGYVDVMGTMQTGGNLGVAVDQMETFARSYAALVSATDQKIAGEAGAETVANFLQITDRGVQNIERFGSSLVQLGNTYNATEDKILDMGIRMASAANLAGFTTPQILGMATAFTSMGINAEAGGSAASKTIKQMQLASEVGLKAQELFGAEHGSAVSFQRHLDTLKKADLVTIAEDLGTTTEYITSMADSWLSLEQFAQLSNKTSDQFAKDWGSNPAQSLVDFFGSLNKLDASGAESALSALDRIGITEIRQSNLIAAMTSNPELFAKAIQTAMQAYDTNTAMWTEFQTQVNTQASQNAMLGNKLENTMADFGDNLVTAVQPALDVVNDLLTAFNDLSEVDQQRIITVMGALAVTGPVLIGLGKITSAVGAIARVVGSAPSWGPKLTSFFSGPAGWVALGTGALIGLIGYLDSIPSKTEQIINSLNGIKINIDQESLNQAKADIESVQAMVDLLAGGAVTEEMEKVSAAVQMGYGTNSMYHKALAYEAQKIDAEVQRITTDYTSQIAAAEQQIINATSDADKMAAQALANSLVQSMDAALVDARSGYAQTVSNLFNGVVSDISKQYPELATQVEKAAQQYDVLSALWAMPDYETVGEEAFRAYQDKIFDLAKTTGYLDKMDMAYATSMAGIGNPAMFVESLREQVESDLRDSFLGMNQNPVLAEAFMKILDNPAITENLDFSNLQGALDGVAKTLDFAQAGQKALENGNAALYGQYLVIGLSDGITANAGLISPGFEAIRNSSIAALQSVFQMHSPSQLMAAQGIYISQGLAQGILAGQSAVINAAISVATKAIQAAKSTLGIASPSREFMQLGLYTGEGFAMGIENSYALVGKAVEGMLPKADDYAWSLIDEFNGLELSDQDMKHIRELAERQVIRSYTAPEINVEFTAHNNINSELDIDYVMDQFAVKLEDAIACSAEGIYT